MMEALSIKQPLSRRKLVSVPSDKSAEKPYRLSEKDENGFGSRSQRLQLIIVEDKKLLRSSLASLLQTFSEIELLGQYEMKDFSSSARIEVPDVILLGGGDESPEVLQLINSLKSLFPESQVLVLGESTNPVFVRQLIAMGVNGYISWHSDANELMVAVRRVSGGNSAIDSRVASKLLDGFLSRQDSRMARSDLTARELVVLKMVVRGYTGEQMAKKMGISKHTVDTHRSRAMKKLGIKKREEIIRYGAAQGWLQLQQENDLDFGSE